VFNDKDGVYIENSRKVVVTGNICIGNDNGIFVHGCDNSDIYANITNDNFSKGILVQFCDYCFVSQNKSVANFENGLCVGNSKRITIYKNLCVCHAVYDALFCNIKQCKMEKNEFKKVENIK
jgi:parallel beta-helix repeat protein